MPANNSHWGRDGLPLPEYRSANPGNCFYLFGPAPPPPPKLIKVHNSLANNQYNCEFQDHQRLRTFRPVHETELEGTYPFSDYLYLQKYGNPNPNRTRGLPRGTGRIRMGPNPIRKKNRSTHYLTPDQKKVIGAWMRVDPTTGNFAYGSTLVLH